MKAWIESRNAKKAVIVGGGFIGLEMAENLSLKWFFSLAFTQRPGSGLHVGSLGGVVVDEQMVTSDPRIQAVGDVVEVKNLITGAGRIIPF